MSRSWLNLNYLSEEIVAVNCNRVLYNQYINGMNYTSDSSDSFIEPGMVYLSMQS